MDGRWNIEKKKTNTLRFFSIDFLIDFIQKFPVKTFRLILIIILLSLSFGPEAKRETRDLVEFPSVWTSRKY